MKVIFAQRAMLENRLSRPSKSMGVRAPLTKIASLCLSIEVSLLPLQNPAIQFNSREKLLDDFRRFLNKGKSLSTV